MIKVNDIGYQFVNLGGIDINRSKGTDDYLFLYFRCPVEVWLDGEYRLVDADTFFLYKEGDMQRYRKTDGHYINDWIHLKIEPYDDFFEELGIPFNTPIKLSDSKPVTDLIMDLFMEYFNVGELHEKIMEQKASTLFHKISDLYNFSQKNGTKMTKYLQELIEIRKNIQSHEYCPKDAKEIAEKLNISTSYLQHLYKSFFGIALNQDIIKARIEYAAHLLNGTGCSITEVARLSGYDNLEHFSRQFKKIKGCAPSKYKK